MGLKIDGIASSQHLDSSGEVLDIAGHDITDLVEGKGVLNFEHKNGPEDIIGAVIYAKKIMDKSDASTDRQKMYWDLCKKPFVYIVGELFDDEEHPGAIAVASMIRYYAKRKEKLLVGYSIEGSTLDRDGNYLKRSVGRRVACTLRPCNKSCLAGLLEEGDYKDAIDSMEKSEARTFEIDSTALVMDDSDLPGNDPVLELYKALQDLNKTMEAGMGNVAPGSMVGNAALAREHISGSVKNRIRAAVRDWNRIRPLRETIKAALPEVSDEYVDHFTRVAEDVALKKNMPPLVRVGKSHAHGDHDEDQQSLLEGIYVDPKASLELEHQNYDVGKNILRAKNDAGQDVILKSYGQHHPDPDHEDHSRAAQFHRLAKDFFGMGEHVPVTAVFKHPSVFGGVPVQAMEFKEGRTPYESDEAWTKALAKAHEDGSGHKLAIMDHILGNWDRHTANMIIGKDGKIHAIDNDNALTYGDKIPTELMSHVYHSAPSKETIEWLKSKDPKQMAKMMQAMGVSSFAIPNAVKRLISWQHHLGPYDTVQSAYRQVMGFKKEKEAV